MRATTVDEKGRIHIRGIGEDRVWTNNHSPGLIPGATDQAVSYFGRDRESGARSAESRLTPGEALKLHDCDPWVACRGENGSDLSPEGRPTGEPSLQTASV
jgi:hypothetical protein